MAKRRYRQARLTPDDLMIRYVRSEDHTPVGCVAVILDAGELYVGWSKARSPDVSVVNHRGSGTTTYVTRGDQFDKALGRTIAVGRATSRKYKARHLLDTRGTKYVLGDLLGLVGSALYRWRDRLGDVDRDILAAMLPPTTDSAIEVA